MRIAPADEDDPCTARLVGPGEVRPLPPSPPWSTRGGNGGGPLEIGPASPAAHDYDVDSAERARHRRRTGGALGRSPLALCSALAILVAIALAITSTIFVAITSIMGRMGSRGSGAPRGGDEPNPPPLPDTMRLYSPPRTPEEAEEIRAEIERLASDPTVTWEFFAAGTARPRPDGYPEFTYTTDRHFSSRRTALLFAPGIYENLDFEVGYYTSVIGLGGRPDDVLFSCAKGPHVPALEKYTNRPPWGSGLDTFWRSMENVAVDAEEGTRWTVSQAAPIRRVHVLGDLDLFEGDSWVSGGVAANCAVDGAVNLGGQQQWLLRNVRVGRGVENGSWSLVLVGCTGSLREESDGMAGGPSVTREDSPAVRVEKPYIVLQRPAGQIDDETTDAGDEVSKISSAIRRDLSVPDGTQTGAGSTATGTFQLRVPRPSFGSDASGPDHSGLNDEVRDFSRVRLASARDDSRSLQEALDDGKDLVLSPGIYHLNDSLTVGRDGQVILGLGYATLVSPPDGRPCIRVLSGVRGARIAGVMLEASSAGTDSADPSSAGAADGVSSLLEWGDPSSNDAGDPRNPGAMSDVFARVGGDKRDVVPIDAMVRIHSGNVYGDNLWLWRADHVALMEGEEANFPEISRRYRQTVK